MSCFSRVQMVLGPERASVYSSLQLERTLAGESYEWTWSGVKDQPALDLRGLDSWSKIAGLADKELIDTLSSEESSDRERARRELVKRGDKNRKALIKLLFQRGHAAGREDRRTGGAAVDVRR